uniref:Protein kinase domain-containing protein n=1 Tax=Brassica campestris TaxID=3711 RepID=M4F3I5_BRACM
MEILMFLVRIYLVSSVLVAASSSGLDLLSPSSSPPPPLPETSKGFGEVPISSPESHKPGNAPPPKASLPSSPPLADVAAPPPSYSSGTKAPNREPIVSVPSAPGPVSSPVSDIPPFPSVALPQPTPSIVPPRNASNKKPVAPVASPPTISVDISPPVIPKLPHSRSPDSPTSTAPSPPKFNGHSHHTSSSPPLNHLHHQEPKKIKDSPPPPPPKMSNRPISSSMHPISIAPSPSPTQGLLPPLLKLFPTTHRQNLIAKLSFISPKAFPLRSSSKPRKLPPLQALPPPPPNSDCSSTVCLDPYTNTPPGSPCGCVWPIQVELRLTMPLYDFFPMVSEFAREISAGVFMKQSQVRIMGANAATEQPDKTILLIDLVPLGDKFDNMTAMLTYQRFYRKKVYIDATTFGQYEVVYVRYPGLPVSPPSGGMTVIDHEPFSRNNNNNGMVKKPFGVDVPKKMRRKEINGGSIAVIVLSAAAFIGLCFVVVWFLAFRRGRARRRLSTRASLPSLTKPPGSVRSLTGSRFSSTSLSFESSIAPLTLSAKTFTASEIVKATSNFAESRVLGEGGFGKVYEGLFDDGTKVAVKVLKRDDQQGGREFLAEVEMLSRLHHRNLVNLIGICIEDRNRSLVYELIPNGSVESHLHGVDKESLPLDWEARLKIALGAARGLAYLHEDSNPRVIHRDFKSSNILLEQDFTPKVSDFGLARNALDDEDNRHISTRVMGTFGYVAPEYAMTGHLLVKSDVYSYGVVLLELLTGRKPVDMSQPPGQENLVSWTRSFLTSREGLEAIIDQSLGQPEIPFDSIAKVAAIASMCVQPEVSHRPFMGEVVQALKLVCNECDEAKELNSVTSLTHDDLGDDNGAESSCGGEGSRRMVRYPLLPSYDSEPGTERGLSVSEMFTGSGRLERVSNSGPLASGGGKRFWQKMRRLSTGSLSEHGSSSLMVRSGSR